MKHTYIVLKYLSKYIKQINIRKYRHLEDLTIGPFLVPGDASDCIVIAGPNGGGKSSILNKISLKYPDGKERVPLSKDMIEDIPKGTIYYQIASGGGGFGDPKERDREKVIMDMKIDVCSVEKAREDYGVEVDK